jgi:transposase
MLYKTETLSVASNNQQGLETNAIARISSFRQVYCATVVTERQGAQMDIREQKGLQIAATSKLHKDGDIWVVPSQAGHGTRYTVNPDPRSLHCSCPDYEFRQSRCKHIFAVEYTIRREYSDDGQTQTVTETVTVKKTYRQEWPAYNRAQTQEKAQFQSLLHELCKGIGEPSQRIGRPRLPFDEMIFATTFKVYSTVSQRRFICDLQDAHAKGYISKVPHFNSISNYLESETLTPYLKMVIEESSLPLQAIERDFAVDSSGFSTGIYQRWNDAKWDNVRIVYGDAQPNMVKRQDWVKAHVMCGVKTNIVTAIEVSHGHGADHGYFEPLVEATSQNFVMDSVCADKAYSSYKNTQLVLAKAAMPYIAFKSNAKANHKSPAAWRRMFRLYSYKQEEFMRHYHQRSNVESTFAMIKAKFGDKVRSKTWTAQMNEVLCKTLCHNICCVIQSMFELNGKPEFWAEAA